MLEAALFQLRNGAEGVDPIYASQLELCFSVMATALAGARVDRRRDADPGGRSARAAPGGRTGGVT